MRLDAEEEREVVVSTGRFRCRAPLLLESCREPDDPRVEAGSRSSKSCSSQEAELADADTLLSNAGGYNLQQNTSTALGIRILKVAINQKIVFKPYFTHISPDYLIVFERLKF